MSMLILLNFQALYCSKLPSFQNQSLRGWSRSTRYKKHGFRNPRKQHLCTYPNIGWARSKDSHSDNGYSSSLSSCQGAELPLAACLPP